MKRQYCASCYVIDFSNGKVLLMYNHKLKKWLQPGGHIKDEELELPSAAAIREVKEETGIDISLIGESFDHGDVQPIAIEHYSNSVGDMIDIQYVGVPLTKKILYPPEEAMWQDISFIDDHLEIDSEIKEKVKVLYQKYRK